MRSAAVIAVFVPAIAAAAPPRGAPPPPAPSSSDMIVEELATRPSPLEPGALDRGDIAIRFGVGGGHDLFGIGGELIVGLGSVEVAVSSGFLPEFCLDLGELGGGCDPAMVMVGLGAQVELAELGWLKLGARAHGSTSLTGDDFGIVSAGLVASTGGPRWRFAALPTVLGMAEEGNPLGENGFYVGGMLGVSYVTPHGGVELLVGAGAPVSGQDDVMPMVQLAGFAGT